MQYIDNYICLSIMQDYEGSFINYLAEDEINEHVHDDTNGLRIDGDHNEIETIHGPGAENTSLNIFRLSEFTRAMSLPKIKLKSQIHTDHEDQGLNERNQLPHEEPNNCVRTSLKVN